MCNIYIYIYIYSFISHFSHPFLFFPLSSSLISGKEYACHTDQFSLKTISDLYLNIACTNNKELFKRKKEKKHCIHLPTPFSTPCHYYSHVGQTAVLLSLSQIKMENSVLSLTPEMKRVNTNLGGKKRG